MTIDYIGSKKSLLSFLDEIICATLASPPSRLGDGFCGTGSVGSFFSTKYSTCIQAIDMEKYSVVITEALLNSPYTAFLKQEIARLNKIPSIDGLVTRHYSPQSNRLFFTVENAQRIDAIRQEIDQASCTDSERLFLLASLVCSADKVANVSCVYGAFLKEFKASAKKPFRLEPIHTRCGGVGTSTVHQGDVCSVDWSGMDAVYFDPPYNSRQYGANYFLLNDILEYKDKSQEMRTVTGLTNYYKSPFCQKTNVVQAFTQLLSNPTLPQHVFISYNNEGLLDEDTFHQLLERFGTVSLHKKTYKKFKAQSSVRGNQVEEYLWILKRGENRLLP